jgi:phage gp36-like protein
MAYITPAEMLKRFDVRILGDLVSDSGVRVSATSLLSDPNLQAALDDASGQINAAILVAQRYTPSQLSALTGVDAAFLYWLTATLAYGRLRLRRGVKADELPEYKDALEMLQALRDGARVFNVLANEEDGNPTFGFPSLTTYAYVNLMRDYAYRYFPRRRYQIPVNPEGQP